MLLPTFLSMSLLPYSSAFSILPLPYLQSFIGPSHAQEQQKPLQESLGAWIEQEKRVALDNLLANVAPGGRNVEGKGVIPGTVVASPSQDSPDYWYQCTLIPVFTYSLR